MPNFGDLLVKIVKEGFAYTWTGECGPQTLKKDETPGKYQSPIDIKTEEAIYAKSLVKNPLSIEYQDDSCFEIKNTGHTFQVDGYQKNPSIVKGGPVMDDYQFLQFHMHWGDTLEHGSEHLIDGHAYSAEIHFVNWNYKKYSDPKEACQSNKHDGLVVLGVFVTIGGYNEEFENVVRHVEKIHLKNEHIKTENIDLSKLLPLNTEDYWTYCGSLTTPPFSECVQWVVFKEPLEISEEQFSRCVELYDVTNEEMCSENTRIKYNDRPVCSMGDRKIHKSFTE